MREGCAEYAASPGEARGEASNEEKPSSARCFARDVLLGLADRPRWLPCRYLYDARGSAIFDAITRTPEYYPTRTEATILRDAAVEIARLTGPLTLVELGAGSSTKTGCLLDAYEKKSTSLRYVPVDVSAAALASGEKQLARHAGRVTISPICGTYARAFPLLRDMGPLMVIFLGSTIGNLNQTEAAAFWEHVTQHLSPGDFFLLGADLVKDPATINAAYNDAGGVTASFTRNLFARMNRELLAGLDLSLIRHHAAYNPAWQRIETFAVFDTAQTLHLAPLGQDVAIAAGERIMTEISRKFVLEELETYLSCFGFRLRRVFTDPKCWFAELLLEFRGRPDRKEEHHV